MSTTSFKPPKLAFAPLPYPQAQGSAELTHAGYTVLASANGPIDPPPRSQQAEEATVEVNLRGNAGLGGPRERRIERLLLQTLRPLIDVRAHPRSMMQVTLQVLRTSRDTETTTPIAQAESVVGILPTLVNTSIAALLDAGVAMTGVAVAVGIVTPPAADDEDDEEIEGHEAHVINDEKAVEEVAAGAAIHAFAFTGKQQLLLAVSEGVCDVDTWEAAASTARHVCCGSGKGDEGMIGWLRGEIGAELTRTKRWKQDGHGE